MNRAITSDFKWADFKQPLLKLNYQLLQLALVENGYSADRYSSLAPYCSVGLNAETECRKGSIVQYYINALALGIDLETIPNIQTCDTFNVIAGSAFAGTFATLTTALTGVNNDLVYTAKERGTDGNTITVAYVVAGNNTPLTVAVAGKAITVNVATGAGGAATSTATLVANAIRANAAANALVGVANATANTGAGIVTALASTSLTGGTN